MVRPSTAATNSKPDLRRSQVEALASKILYNISCLPLRVSNLASAGVQYRYKPLKGTDPVQIETTSTSPCFRACSTRIRSRSIQPTSRDSEHTERAGRQVYRGGYTGKRSRLRALDRPRCTPRRVSAGEKRSHFGRREPEPTSRTMRSFDAWMKCARLLRRVTSPAFR